MCHTNYTRSPSCSPCIHEVVPEWLIVHDAVDSQEADKYVQKTGEDEKGGGARFENTTIGEYK